MNKVAYFAVCCFDGELYNGGFDQFFANSSGSYYQHALVGLEELGAQQVVELLRRAKQVLFDFAEVPTDTGQRRMLLRTTCSDRQGDDAGIFTARMTAGRATNAASTR
jgi:hypothetical protein